MQYHKVILIALACAALGGCAMPAHSNALIFATNTTIALDVSASPTAGAPNITLGYKRQEAAWVPLLANQGSSAPDNDDRPSYPCNTSATDNSSCVFKGTDGEGVSDAYSVLASLEGGTNITTGADGVKTEAHIGQYFATGLAARLLAIKGGAQTVNPAASAPADTISPAATQLATKIETAQTANLKKIDGGLRGDSNYVADRDALIAKAYPAGGAKAAYLKTFATKDQLMAALKSDYTTSAALAAQIP